MKSCTDIYGEPLLRANRPHSSFNTIASTPNDAKADSSDSPRMVSHTQTFPENRLSVVFVGLMCCAFLSALDQVSIYHTGMVG